jgi:hypothetical protein
MICSVPESIDSTPQEAGHKASATKALERPLQQSRDFMTIRLVALAVAGFAMLHAYFFLAFGSFDPCTAATFRLVNSDASGTGEALVYSSKLDQALRSRGLLACYRTAITGETPEGIF